MPPTTPNSPKADPRGTSGEEMKHKVAELHEMIKKEAKKLSKLKDDVTQKIVELTSKLTDVVIEETKH